MKLTSFINLLFSILTLFTIGFICRLCINDLYFIEFVDLFIEYISLVIFPLPLLYNENIPLICETRNNVSNTSTSTNQPNAPISSNNENNSVSPIEDRVQEEESKFLGARKNELYFKSFCEENRAQLKHYTISQLRYYKWQMSHIIYQDPQATMVKIISVLPEDIQSLYGTYVINQHNNTIIANNSTQTSNALGIYPAGNNSNNNQPSYSSENNNKNNN
jgi:hypothetical protein